MSEQPGGRAAPGGAGRVSRPTAPERVGVLGGGRMGAGIAHAFLVAGSHVTVVERDDDAAEAARTRVLDSVAASVARGTTDETADAIGGRLAVATDVDGFAGAGLVIEAVPEDLDLKLDALTRVEAVLGADAALATNTSSISIDALADRLDRPARFLGLHFFNPVPLMKLVEVVRAAKTSEEALAPVRSFAEGIGKTPVLAKDTPGFIVNRLLVPYLVEAIRMVERGEASRENVDAAMKLGCGYPMGPIELLDYVGLDTTLAIVEGWHRRFPGEKLFEPPALLRDLVKRGQTGRKSGPGFYEWEGDRRK